MPDLVAALRVFFTLTLACVLVEAVCALVFHLGEPYNRPFSTLNKFSDFTEFQARFHAFHTPGFVTLPGSPYTYPAVSAAIQSIFYFCPHPLAVYLASILAGFGIAGVLLFRRLRALGLEVGLSIAAAGALAIASPLWFEFVRANMEFVVWCVLAIGICSYVRGRTYLAAAFFAIAVGMKLYPVLFFGLFVVRREYRQVVFGTVVGIAAFVSSLWLETGSVALSWHVATRGIRSVNSALYTVLPFNDHSIFEFVKQAVVLSRSAFHHHLVKLTPEEGLRLEYVYFVVFGLVAAVFFFSRARKVPVLNQIVMLAVGCVLLPPVSFDYTLIQLFVPCGLLMVAAVRWARSHPGESLPGLRRALLLMAVIIAPETELTIHGRTISSGLKCVSLIALAVVASRNSFGDSGEGSAHEERAMLSAVPAQVR